MTEEKNRAFQGSKPQSRAFAGFVLATVAMIPAVPLSAESEMASDHFSSEFAPFTAKPIRVELQPSAVDITKIDIPREAKAKPKLVAQSYKTQRDMGVVVASYYGKRFHGRRTANGERFNMNAMTAAHKKLRFGTKVRITNVANGRSVVVRINDRGPYIRGRTIDLSRAAAAKIGMIQRGHARVKMEIVS